MGHVHRERARRLTRPRFGRRYGNLISAHARYEAPVSPSGEGSRNTPRTLGRCSTVCGKHDETVPARDHADVIVIGCVGLAVSQFAEQGAEVARPADLFEEAR